MNGSFIPGLWFSADPYRIIPQSTSERIFISGRNKLAYKHFFQILKAEGSIYHNNQFSDSKSDSASCNRSIYLGIFLGLAYFQGAPVGPKNF